MSEDIPRGSRFLHSDDPFDFHLGGTLARISLAYETWGELNSARDNGVMILTGLSPSAHAARHPENNEDGWWEPMVGPGKPIDTNRFFVICINSLGSCKGSTGPASINPESGKPWRLEFPQVTVQDIASSATRVIDHLGIDQLLAVVGPSLGGMSGLAWLQQNPGRARHFLSISTAAAAEPFAIAIRSLQRECIVSDRLWLDGKYSDDERPATGMRLARKLGMLSYRSPQEMTQRFGRREEVMFEHYRFGMDFAIESYLERAAVKFVGGFDPCCYLYLSYALDLFDASEGYDSLEEAVAPIVLDSKMVIGVKTDILWPLHQQSQLANAFKANGVKTEFLTLDSIQGHDSFLVDYDRFLPAVDAYLKTIK
ncbi:MAG TPA: homoserine O-acetyltransferase [Xanthomonadales bacterium]|nr:homoserine O-acetyltransferase [Xanthomonadales bacterium]